VSFLDRLRTKNAAIPLDAPAADLGDASPQHYLTDDPEADAPSDPWRYGFTRRRFLQGGAAVALGCAELSRQLITSTFSFRPAYASEVDQATKTLVVLFLRGGIDGLNVVVPHGDSVYYEARPSLAIARQSDQLIDLGDGMFGLNAALQPLMSSWNDGKLAIAHAVASPDRTRSHFEAMRVMETGGAGTGYLDRYMQLRAERSAFSSVTMEGRLPQSMSGPVGELALGGSVDNFRLRGPDPDPDTLARVIRMMYDPLNHPAAAQVASTMSALETAELLTDTGYEPANGAEYPPGPLGDKLREVARLIKADVGLQVAAIDAGGFDTHTNERADLDRHLTEIGAAVAAWVTDLGDQLDNVTLMTMSEFGRRIAENNNAGTDHGLANFMFMLGGGVRGGRVYTEWPGLENDEGGDLAQAIDYRSILGEWMMAHGGVGSLNQVFPGFEFQEVGFTTT
jgi:uncharacterized protein (DUF1501 family)